MADNNPSRIIDNLSKDIDVFDGDYIRSYGPKDATKKMHEFMRMNPTKANLKDLKVQFPQADDDLINDALNQIETVDSFAGAPMTPEHYYRGIRYEPGKEQDLKEETFHKVNSKLPF